jgi:hypothetical protein
MMLANLEDYGYAINPSFAHPHMIEEDDQLLLVLCNQLRSLQLRLLAKEDKECYTKAMLEAYYNTRKGGGRSLE